MTRLRRVVRMRPQFMGSSAGATTNEAAAEFTEPTAPTLSWELTAAQAVHEIALVDSLRVLGDWEASEESNPKFPGGRSTVLKAIGQRFLQISNLHPDAPL
jgi:hypothetical protein